MTGSEPVIYGTFDGETLLTLLAEVDAELAEHPDGEPVHLVIVGGAAMALLMDARCTGDVDVVSETVTGELREATRRVAQRHGLRPDWINDAAKLKAVNVAVEPERIYSGDWVLATATRSTSISTPSGTSSGGFRSPRLSRPRSYRLWSGPPGCPRCFPNMRG